MKAATRLVFFIAGIVVAMSGTIIRAEAQNYPWCAQYSGNFGGTMNCGFVSFEQCMATVRGMGGFCVVNNTYHPPRPAAPLRRQAWRLHGA